MPCRPLLVVLLAALVAGGCSRAEPAGGRTAAPTPGTATPATAGSATTTGPAPTTGGPASAATGRSPTTAAARPRYRFPVAGCRVSYGRFPHD